MAKLDLYIDTYAQSLVIGPTNRGPFILPPFTQNDTISLRVYLLERTTSFPFNPYTIVNNAALSLAMAIGDRSGSGDGDHIVEQFTWNRDANNSYFYADVAFNTSELATAIASNPTLNTKYLEIEYRQNSLPTTVLQQLVNINADVIKQTTQALAAGLTAQSAEDANARFAKLFGLPGETITLRSPNGNWGRILGVDDDGNRIDDLEDLS